MKANGMLMLLKAPLTVWKVMLTHCCKRLKVKSVRLTSTLEAAQSIKWSASEWLEVLDG